MRRALSFLAERRWAGVGLALVAECAALAALALAPPSAVEGIPAAIAAAIAGTVAVVFGVVDGVAVAVAGAVVFAGTGGWDAGELAAIGIWPPIVAAVGLFARRVERRRRTLGRVLTAQEEDRRRVALELHDQVAQALASALMTLQAAGRANDAETSAAAAAQAREMINQAIRTLRALAVELSPRALEDYGLAPALERLASELVARTGIDVDVDGRWRGRAPDEVELVLFRVVQEALAAAAAGGAQSVRVVVDREGGTLVAVVEQLGGADALTAVAEPLRERLSLLGGRLASSPLAAGGRSLRAEVPAVGRPAAGV